MLGWSEEELRGKPMQPAVHFQRADGIRPCPRVLVTAPSPLKGGTSGCLDDAFTRKDGSIFPVAYSAAPLRSGRASAASSSSSATSPREGRADTRPTRARTPSPGSDGSATRSTRTGSSSTASRSSRSTGGQASEELLLRMIGRDGRDHPARKLPARRGEVRADRRNRPLGHHPGHPLRGRRPADRGEPLRRSSSATQTCFR